MDPLPDCLTHTVNGYIRLTGTRVGLEHVLEHHLNGETIDQMREWFPHVTHEHVRQVLDFYSAHKVAVDEYYQRWLAEYERLAAATPGPDWEAMRLRLAAKRAELERQQAAGS